MVQRMNNQKISHNAFTLIEMVIVLIIMGIMLMLTASLSGHQIQKVKNKTVKESILAEMLTRYSRNLGSSSFAGNMYSIMDINIKKGENKIDFEYNVDDGDNIKDSFTNNYEIRYITFDSNSTDSDGEASVNIRYHPYKISCEIGENKDNVFIIARVNNVKDYCFEIKQKNCRFVEVPEESCNTLRIGVGMND